MGETMSDAPPIEPDHPDLVVATRDGERLRESLTAWLTDRLPEGADPGVPEIGSTSANGMSSETVLFEARWTDTGGRMHRDELVARIAPDEANEPVFPDYELGHQFELMTMVADLTDVPVPRTRWIESDPTVIGSPFFVMDRVDGLVPPDVMPYTFGDNWLFDAAPDQQRRMQDSTVGVLAALHGIDRPEARFAFLASGTSDGSALRRHVDHCRAWYDFAAARSMRSTMVEAGFRWLDDHWPADEGATVLSWGDARIGNVMYRDFEPVAVLDWEMAGLGPRELDLGWLIFAHRVFESLAQSFDLPGMAYFLRADDVAGTYEAISGHTPRDLDFYLMYAAVQWGIVFMRTGARQAHFGEIEMPADVDDLLHHRSLFAQLLAT